VTISYFPSCSATLDPERYNLANLFDEAVSDEPAGKVVVLASNGYTDTSRLARGAEVVSPLSRAPR
jgi:4-hydroxy-4-methyl-2-oxoglutarate aldolase